MREYSTLAAALIASIAIIEDSFIYAYGDEGLDPFGLLDSALKSENEPVTYTVDESGAVGIMLPHGNEQLYVPMLLGGNR